MLRGPVALGDAPQAWPGKLSNPNPANSASQTAGSASQPANWPTGNPSLASTIGRAQQAQPSKLSKPGPGSSASQPASSASQRASKPA